jgi:hypothetical protein
MIYGGLAHRSFGHWAEDEDKIEEDADVLKNGYSNNSISANVTRAGKPQKKAKK